MNTKSIYFFPGNKHLKKSGISESWEELARQANPLSLFPSLAILFILIKLSLKACSKKLIAYICRILL